MAQITGRTEARHLIKKDELEGIIKSAAERSVVMSLATRLRNMTSAEMSMKVEEALPFAYWVKGDTGLKETSKMTWAGREIVAAELAVILAIPDNVRADSDYDIWGAMRPRVEEAIGAKVDLAVLHNIDKPSEWPDGITAQAAAKNKVLDLSNHLATAGNSLWTAFLDDGGLYQMIEKDGFDPNYTVGLPSFKAKLRGVKDSTGRPIMKAVEREGLQGRTVYSFDDADFIFQKNVSPDDVGNTLAITGDWSQMVYSIRQDATYSVHRDGVINDSSGNIIYNLMQQDMQALRVVMRLGWQIPNPPNRLNPDEATRFPFSVLVA